MDVRLGLDGKLYYNAGTYDIPDWQEWTNIIDAALNLKATEANVTTRADGGWEILIPALKQAEITAGMLKDRGPEYGIVRTSWLARRPRQPIEVLYLDDDISLSGTEGWRMTVAVFNFANNDQLAEGQKIDLSLKPTKAAHPPEFYVVP